MNLSDFVRRFGSAWVAFTTRSPNVFVIVADAYHLVEVQGKQVMVTQLTEPRVYKRVRRYIKEVGLA